MSRLGATMAAATAVPPQPHVWLDGSHTPPGPQSPSIAHGAPCFDPPSPLPPSPSEPRGPPSPLPFPPSSPFESVKVESVLAPHAAISSEPTHETTRASGATRM